ncbi:TraB/GumN family protein [Burkholderia cepacia]|uniref:TraB/GumN family protein n=1 Tax=Burkholderia cepacia TaxID=292 RepID=UPI0026560E1E|nr:TraB/GumN family protein [Burkholderia cepacia]MDN7638086.1 TraB/GumN family protein [Burkholderia cepacia]
MTSRPSLIKSIVAALAVAVNVVLLPVAAHASSGVPALEVKSPSGGRSILLGTLHVADPKLLQPDPSVLDGFQTLVLEHPGFGAPASAPGWVTSLSANQIAQLRSHLQCRFPMLKAADIEQGLKAYLEQPTPTAANQLAYETCDAVGYRSRDEIVMTSAVNYHVQLRYLETDEEVGRLRLQLPADNVKQSFNVAFSPAAALLKARVVDALNRGDFADAAATSEESQVLAGDDPKQVHAIMVRHRNAEWLKALPGLLENGGAFVLVGVAHLPGADGLIAGLRARGFAVEPILLPAGSGR